MAQAIRCDEDLIVRDDGKNGVIVLCVKTDRMFEVLGDAAEAFRILMANSSEGKSTSPKDLISELELRSPTFKSNKKKQESVESFIEHFKSLKLITQ